MSAALRAVVFTARATPLAPCAAYACEAAAESLARALLDAAPERLRALQCVADASSLLVLGPEQHLPWVDGIQYLGRDLLAPALLLPVVRAPDVPIDIFERAVLARTSAARPPIAVLEDAKRLIPVGHARSASADALRSWLREHPP